MYIYIYISRPQRRRQRERCSGTGGVACDGTLAGGAAAATSPFAPCGRDSDLPLQPRGRTAEGSWCAAAVARLRALARRRSARRNMLYR